MRQSMMLLTTAAHPQILEYLHPNLGRLVQPRHYSSIEATAEAGIPWAADNDAFGGWTKERSDAFERMLERIAGLAGCLFVTSPDVVGDPVATTYLYEEWAPIIMRRRQPVAFVCQDGCVVEDVPWGSCDAVFIGGADDRYKMSADVVEIVREARRRGKWAHMGRVNSARRTMYAKSIGCDSFDGTTFSQWRDRWLPEGLGWASAPAQMRLDEVG